MILAIFIYLYVYLFIFFIIIFFLFQTNILHVCITAYLKSSRKAWSMAHLKNVLERSIERLLFKKKLKYSMPFKEHEEHAHIRKWYEK